MSISSGSPVPSASGSNSLNSPTPPAFSTSSGGDPFDPLALHSLASELGLSCAAVAQWKRLRRSLEHSVAGEVPLTSDESQQQVLHQLVDSRLPSVASPLLHAILLSVVLPFAPNPPTPSVTAPANGAHGEANRGRNSVSAERRTQDEVAASAGGASAPKSAAPAAELKSLKRESASGASLMDEPEAAARNIWSVGPAVVPLRSQKHPPGESVDGVASAEVGGDRRRDAELRADLLQLIAAFRTDLPPGWAGVAVRSSIGSTLEIPKQRIDAGSIAGPRASPLSVHGGSFSSRAAPPLKPPLSSLKHVGSNSVGGAAALRQGGAGGGLQRDRESFTNATPTSFLQLLPGRMQTSDGVRRIASICPPFVPLLMEALLKEGIVRSTQLGEASRRAFLFLLESVVPVIAAMRAMVRSFFRELDLGTLVLVCSPTAAPDVVAREVNLTAHPWRWTSLDCYKHMGMSAVPLAHHVGQPQAYSDAALEPDTAGSPLRAAGEAAEWCIVAKRNGTTTSLPGNHSSKHVALIRGIAWMERILHRITLSAASLLELVDDSVWALSAGVALIFSGISPPQPLCQSLHHHSKSLSKFPGKWTPETAAAYAIVALERLRPFASEEIEQVRSLPVSGNEKDVPHTPVAGSTVANTSPSVCSTAVMMTSSKCKCNETPSEGMACDGGKGKTTPPIHSRSSSGKGRTVRAVAAELTGTARQIGRDGLNKPTYVALSSVYERFLAKPSSSLPGGPTSAVAPDSHATGASDPSRASFNQLAATLMPQPWPFPDYTPRSNAQPSCIIMSTLVLLAAPLSTNSVMSIAQWCLLTMKTVPRIPTGIPAALTQLTLRYPDLFREVAMAGVRNIYLSDSLALASCRAMEEILDRSTTFIISEVYHAPHSPSRYVAAQREGLSARDDVGVVDTAAAVDLRVAQSLVLLLLVSIRNRRSRSLHGDLQAALGKLFVRFCRLELSVSAILRHGAVQLCNASAGPPVARNERCSSEKQVNHGEEVLQCDGAEPGLGTETDCSQNAPVATSEGATPLAMTTPPSTKAPNPVPPSAHVLHVARLVDQLFHCVAVAVDEVLHDYAAGCPRKLCSILTDVVPPQSQVLVELEAAGVVEHHVEVLESIKCAGEAFRPMQASPPTSPSGKEAGQRGIARDTTGRNLASRPIIVSRSQLVAPGPRDSQSATEEATPRPFSLSNLPFIPLTALAAFNTSNRSTAKGNSPVKGEATGGESKDHGGHPITPRKVPPSRILSLPTPPSISLSRLGELFSVNHGADESPAQASVTTRENAFDTDSLDASTASLMLSPTSLGVLFTPNRLPTPSSACFAVDSTVPVSLLGLLPCSGEPLSLTGPARTEAQAGLCALQKQWVLCECVHYLSQQWSLSRTGRACVLNPAMLEGLVFHRVPLRSSTRPVTRFCDCPAVNYRDEQSAADPAMDSAVHTYLDYLELPQGLP